MPLSQHIVQALADIIVILAPHCSVEQTEADTTEENSEEPVEDKEYRQGSKEGIPEPEYEVDLLIDDILCEHTQTIVHLLSSSCSYIRDVAGGHRGEHRAHRVPDTHLWVNPLLVGDAVVVDHVQAIPGKLVIQKFVSQVELNSQQKKV